MSIDNNGVVTNEALARYDAGIKDIIAMRTAEKNPVRYKVVKSTSTGSQTYSFYKKDENDTEFVVDSASDAITVQDSIDSTSKDPVNGAAVAAEFATQMTTQNINSIIGYTPMDSSLKGAANGVASLDGLGQVPVSQLPVVDAYSATGTKPITGTGVAAALATLPEPMVFIGTVGTGGTVTSLPAAANSNKGHTYKAISDNIVSGSKIGDTFISTGSAWVTIPSGDEPSGTVTQVGINASSGSHLSASGTVTSSGNLTVGVESGYQIPSSSDVSQITTNKSNILSVEDMVCATEFSSSTTYAVGDMVTYEHKLYKFINAHQGAWSASDVQNYDLTRMVSDLQKKAVKVYTYHVNPNESDPEDAVTYLDDATGLTPAKMGASSFSYGSWANAWFLPRPCVLKFDGTVDYYLNPNDYSKKTDGTASTIDSSNSTGNVMLEFPKIWVKRVNDGNGARTVSIAPVNVDGTYKCWSNINAEDKEVDHFYLPAYNGTIHSSKMRSLSGVTLNSTYAPNKTRAEEVTLATANNPTGKNMWYTETWADMCLVFDLLYLMGKSLNLQGTFGNGLATGSETVMRAYVTGSLNDKGLFYGDISAQATGVKVLGMENLWGCRWHGVAGLINDNGTLKVKMTYGVADGSTAVGYNTTGSGYLNYGSTYGTAGFVKKMQADNTMGYKIIETAGSDATYYCDYYYTNNAQLNYALIGGSAAFGLHCGFYVNVYNAPAHAHWDVGAALSCRP